MNQCKVTTKYVFATPKMTLETLGKMDETQLYDLVSDKGSEQDSDAGSSSLTVFYLPHPNVL